MTRRTPAPAPDHEIRRVAGESYSYLLLSDTEAQALADGRIPERVRERAGWLIESTEQWVARVRKDAPS